MTKRSFDLRHMASSGWKIFQNSPLLAIGSVNTVTLFVSVFMSLLVVRVLPKEEYGHLVYFYAGFGLLRLLMNFGLGINISRSIATSVDEPERLRVIIYSTSVLSLSATIVVLILLGIIASLTDQPYMQYIAVAAIFASLADLLFAMITGLRLIQSIGLMTAMQPSSYMILTIGLILLGLIRAEQFMQAYLASYVLASILGLILVLRSRALPRFSWRSVQFRYMLTTIGLAIPVYVVTLASQGWVSFSAGTLGVLGEFQAAAEFGVVFNLIMMVVAISSPTLLTTFFPQLSHLFGNQQTTAVTDYIRRTFTMLLYSFLFVAVALFSFSETIVSLLFRDTYQPSAAYLMILAPVAIFQGLTPLFTLTLVAIGRPSRAVIGMSLQLASLVVIVWLGRNGVDATQLSWAALLSSSIGLIVQMSLVRFTLKTSIFSTHLVQIIVLALTAAVVLRYLQSMIGVQLSIWHFVLGGIFTVIYWFRIFRIGNFTWLTHVK